jgi:hypothetical protein
MLYVPFSFNYFISFEVKAIVMLRFVPHHLGIVVSLPCFMLVCPFVIFRFIDNKRSRCLFLIQLEGIVVIGQLVTIVIVSTFFLDAKVSSL